MSTGQIKKIAVLTSGGDAPGMNAAIRAVVRTGISRGLEVHGIISGWSGTLQTQMIKLELGSVANILQRGGTILKSGRCAEFLKPEARALAAQNLRTAGVDGLIVIGGDGSFQGAHALWNEQKIPVIGVPGTIDNDIYGTDYTIGFDTAVNTALESLDRIRDTAASHDRLFIVEVMGRDSGFIAVSVGLASGAEEVFIPERPVTVDQAIQQIQKGLQRGKKSSILIAAEGQKPGRAYDLAEAIRKKAGYEAKVCILGHVQRGGTPSAQDRVLAARMGFEAVQLLTGGRTDVFTGLQNGNIVEVGLLEPIKHKKSVSQDLLNLARILAQ